MRMNQEVKARWVAALRSGSYAQARGKMYDSSKDSFCCLGVLCHSEGIAVGDMPKFIPDAEFCIQIELPFYLSLSFTNRNDGEGYFIGNPQSFEQIADWIEANL